MNKREALDLICIGFGFYLLTRLVDSLHGIAWQLLTTDAIAHVSKWSVVSTETLHSVFMAAMCILLLFRRNILHRLLGDRGETVVVPDEREGSTEERLVFWIRVIGLFFCVTALPFIVAALVDRRFAHPGSYFFTSLVRQGTAFAVGFILIKYAIPLARHLLSLSDRKPGKDDA
jgi:hypothetical protein